MNQIEEIWQSTDGYKYAIEKDVREGRRESNQYRMIILESSSNDWNPTQIRAFIEWVKANLPGYEDLHKQKKNDPEGTIMI